MSASAPTTLRLGTRGSLLARKQSELIASQLRAAHPSLTIETFIIQTSGDRITDRPLHEFGGKGLFVKEIEQALLDHQIDLAVHSYKDVPTTMPLVDVSNLIIAAVPVREDPRDVAVMFDPKRGPIFFKARVGTSSLRRRCQVLEAMPDAIVLDLRGNVDTRIKKLQAGDYDVIVLAMAGLKRAGLFDASFMTPLPILPAPAQGALAVQCRRDDSATIDLLRPIDDPATAQCVNVERAIVAALHGDCHSPIAALATLNNNQLDLTVAVGRRDGFPPIVRAAARGDAESVVAAVMDDLNRQNVDVLLHE